MYLVFPVFTAKPISLQALRLSLSLSLSHTMMSVFSLLYFLENDTGLTSVKVDSINDSNVAFPNLNAKSALKYYFAGLMINTCNFQLLGDEFYSQHSSP